MLLKWKQRLGNKATYRKLKECFSSAGGQDLADGVDEFLRNRSSQSPHGSAIHAPPAHASLEVIQELNRNYLCVCEQISRSPDIISRLADTLHIEGFISVDVQQAVQYTSSLTPYERATRMMGPAIGSLDEHATTFRVDVLIQILEKFDLWPSQPISFKRHRIFLPEKKHGVQQKARIAAKHILQKRIVVVTEVIKSQLNHFNYRLKEKGLIAEGVFDPDDKVMKKAEYAFILYNACMTAVSVDSSKFSVVLDILSGYPLLEEVVQEMAKEGTEAGLLETKLGTILPIKKATRPRQSVFQGLWGSNKFQYASFCYYKWDPEWLSCVVRFLVTLNISPCLQVVKEKYKDWIVHHTTNVEFEEKSPAGKEKGGPSSMSITLQITAPEEWDSEYWKIYPVNPRQIFKQSIDESAKDVSTDIPYCEFFIEWTGSETAKVPFFIRRINLIGAKGPNNYFNFHFCPLRSSSAAASSATGTAGIEAGLLEGRLGTIPPIKEATSPSQSEHGVQQKAGIAAKRILQKRIVTVTEVIKSQLNHFSNRLREEDLIAEGVFDPDDKVMKKSEYASVLYNVCMTAVTVDSSKFSVVLDILSGYPLLEKAVQEMAKEGTEAGLSETIPPIKGATRPSQSGIEAGLLEGRFGTIPPIKEATSPSQSAAIFEPKTKKQDEISQMEQELEKMKKLSLAKESPVVTQDSVTQSNYSSLTGENLQEVTVAGEKLFTFMGSTAQDLVWEQYGFLAHVCSNAFSDQVHKVAVKALVGGKFKFPPDCMLVSAVYAVVLSDKLRHPMKVKLQHCVNIQTLEQAQRLSFVRADFNQPPYTFRALDNGTFDVGSAYGSILCQNFSLVAIVYSIREYAGWLMQYLFPTPPVDSNIIFCAKLFYCFEAGEWNFTFAFYKKLWALAQYVATKMTGTREWSELTFSFKKECVTLEIENSTTIDGWELSLRQYPCQFWWKDVKQSDDSEIGIRYFKMDVFPGHNSTDCLRHVVELRGTVVDNLSFLITCRKTAGSATRSPPVLGIEQLGVIKHKLPNFVEWKTLGLNLGLSRKLDVIEKDYSGVDERLHQVLKHWLQRNYNTDEYGSPTWDCLANALEPINHALADSIRENH